MAVKKEARYDNFTINLGVQLIYHQFAALFTVTDYMQQKTAENTTKVQGTSTRQIAVIITVNIQGFGSLPLNLK